MKPWGGPLVGVVVTAVLAFWWGFSWSTSAPEGADQSFGLCQRSAEVVVLQFNYGPGDAITTSFAPREPDGVTVELKVDSPGGDRPAVNLGGRFAFRAPASDKIYDHADREIECALVTNPFPPSEPQT